MDLSGFNTSKVTRMSWMFANCTFAKLNMSNWDTSNVTLMDGMFVNKPCVPILDLSSFDTSKVINMNIMFSTWWNTPCKIIYGPKFVNTSIKNITSPVVGSNWWDQENGSAFMFNSTSGPGVTRPKWENGTWGAYGTFIGNS